MKNFNFEKNDFKVWNLIASTSGENLSPIPIYGGNGTGMGMGLRFLKMGLSGTEFLGMIEVFK